MATRDNSGFKNALNRLLTPEGFANTVVPILGIVESIASKGQSPGTVATAYRKNILDDVKRQEESETAKWEREQKQRVYDDTSKASALSAKKSQIEIDNASRIAEREGAIPKAMKLADIFAQNPMATPEEKANYRTKMEEKAFRTAYPEKAAEASFKQANTGTYEIDPEGKTPEQIQNLIAQVNQAYPGMKVSVKKPFSSNPMLGLNIQKTQEEIDAMRRKEEDEKRKQAESMVGKTTPQETAQGLIDRISELRNHPGFKGYVGMQGPNTGFGFVKPLPGTPEAGFKAMYDSFIAANTLPNLGTLKGAMSDKDIKFITEASTALSNRTSETDFLRELNKIEQKLIPVATGQSTQVSPTSFQTQPKPLPVYNPKVDRARQALSDPDATPEEKAQAQKIINMYGGR